MFVHLKQSGELLGHDDEDSKQGHLWTPNGVRASADKLAAAHRRFDTLGIEGMVVVSGAGNVVRGDKLKKENIATGLEDFLGRLGTVQNTIVLAKALEALRVPVRVFISERMGISDPSLPTDYLEPYDAEAVQSAHESQRLVLISGGTGEDNKTTDNAIMEYAKRQKEVTPGSEVLALKGTKLDGVFEYDPDKDARARPYRTISAQTMLEDYGRYGVVDRASLGQIVETGIPMRIYADGQHDIAAAVGPGNDHVGTLVVGQLVEPELVA